MRLLLNHLNIFDSVTVAMNIVTMVLILAPPVGIVFHAAFVIPNVAVQNAMACRVYRQLKLGIIQENASPVVSFSGGTLQFRQPSTSMVVVENSADFEGAASHSQDSEKMSE